jgi:hypothetical protein
MMTTRSMTVVRKPDIKPGPSLNRATLWISRRTSQAALGGLRVSAPVVGRRRSFHNASSAFTLKACPPQTISGAVC